MTILKGHISPETAYVVGDYPYGFRLRCKMRYWIEFSERHGFRLATQTTNPKRPGEVWNKPKFSTYSRFGGALWLDDKQHVRFAGLSEYSFAADCVSFRDKYGEGVPDAGKATFDMWVRAKVARERKAELTA